MGVQGGSREIPAKAHTETLCHSVSNSSRLSRKNWSFHFSLSGESQKERELQSWKTKEVGLGLGLVFLMGKKPSNKQPQIKHGRH